jgi:hypothetical protein
MNYELAKQLKDKGFPKDIRFNRLFGHVWNPPTLSELIKACGYVDLVVRNNHSRASQIVGSMDIATEVGSTPEEAVARLWLALHSTPPVNPA